jgi:roadblock/LC7 domain-containing protein
MSEFDELVASPGCAYGGPVRPVRSWTYSGGDYVIAVSGDRFLIAERARRGSLDDLNQLLRAGQP